MAECEVCGRTLKTGRKYCYEHKHSTQSAKYTQQRWEDMILDEAKAVFIIHKIEEEKETIKEKLKNKPFFNKYADKILFILGGLFIFWGISLAVISNILMGLPFAIVGAFCIGFGRDIMQDYKGEKRERTEEKARKMIENKDEEYIKFVKQYIKNANDKIMEEAKHKVDLFNEKKI